MKPQDQTKFGYGEGNCFAACVASILELSIKEMADHQGTIDGAKWEKCWKQWGKARNISFVYFQASTEFSPTGYSIAAVKSPRAECLHSVVAFRERIVHDPHPSRASRNAQIIGYTLMAPIDPSRPFGHQPDS